MDPVFRLALASELSSSVLDHVFFRNTKAAVVPIHRYHILARVPLTYCSRRTTPYIVEVFPHRASAHIDRWLREGRGRYCVPPSRTAFGKLFRRLAFKENVLEIGVIAVWPLKIVWLPIPDGKIGAPHPAATF